MKVIAVGNAFYGDDGIGAAVLDHARAHALWPAAQLVDLQTDALALIDHLDPADWTVVIDAANMGLKPGTVVAFGPDEVNMRIRSDHLSLHGFGLAEAFDLSRRLDKLPKKVLIVGVEPARVEINTGLSAPVAAAVPKVVDVINAEVSREC